MAEMHKHESIICTIMIWVVLSLKGKKKEKGRKKRKKEKKKGNECLEKRK